MAASNPPAANADTSTAPVVVKRGAITGFGSVYVGGKRHETNLETEYFHGDDSVAESDLRVGMVVKMRSRERNRDGEAIAERVEYDEDVKGPIDSISGNVLTVMGQTVNVNADTRFDDALTLTGLAPGDIVEVSGFRLANDELDAVFVDRKSAVNHYEVLGQIRELDTANETFRIGGLTVRYGIIPAELDDLEGGLANDLLVEVKDSNLAYQAGDLILDATKVEGEDRLEFKDEDDDDRDEDEDDFEFEGVISEVVSDTVFRLGDVQVNHDPATTLYVYGTAADIAVGTKVEVEGARTPDGVSADKVKFKKSSARAAGLVNSVDAENGEAVVMGVTIEIGADTRVEDDRDEGSIITLAELMVGDFVEIRGVQFENRIRAMELERDDADDDSELRGTVQAFDVAARTITLYGLTIITNGATEYENSDDDDADERLDADAFFDRLHAGQTIVKAKWDGAVGDTELPARELSLED